MTVDREQFDMLLEKALDGVLTGAEAAEFDAAVAGESRWRDEWERARTAQQQVDRSLRTLFAPPVMEAIEIAGTLGPTVGPERVKARGAGRWMRTVGLALAAGLVLCAGVAAYVMLSGDDARPRPTLTASYAQQVAGGFVPGEVCTDTDAFAAWTLKNYGVALAPALVVGGNGGKVEYVGWSYDRTISTYTGVLLAKVEGRPVTVHLERAEAQRKFGRPREGGAAGLRVFSREVGGVVLYEVTPLEEARVLPRLEVKPKS